MRYGKDVTKRILDILKETPNVRYACMKVGLHHSTFYKWRVHYPDFAEEVMLTLFLGRENISDLAESVIIKGVQNADQNSSRFWLAHNSPRYMTKEKDVQYRRTLKRDALFINSTKDSKDLARFEAYFDPCFTIEELNGEQQVKKLMTPLLKIAFDNNEDIVELFFDSYERWKKNNKERKDAEDEVEGFMNNE